MTAPKNVTAVSVTAVHVPAVAVSALSATAVSRFCNFSRSRSYRPFSLLPRSTVLHQPHPDGLLFE